MRFQALEEAENHVNSRSKYDFKLPRLAQIASFGNPSRAKIHTQLEHNPLSHFGRLGVAKNLVFFSLFGHPSAANWPHGAP